MRSSVSNGSGSVRSESSARRTAVAVRVARKPTVETVGALSGSEQQRRSIAAAALHRRYLPAQRVNANASQGRRRPAVRARGEPQRRFRRPGEVLGFGSRQRALGAVRRIERQPHGALEKRGRGRLAADGRVYCPARWRSSRSSTSVILRACDATAPEVRSGHDNPPPDGARARALIDYTRRRIVAGARDRTLARDVLAQADRALALLEGGFARYAVGERD